MAKITLERLQNGDTRITVTDGTLKVDSKVTVTNMDFTASGMQFDVYSKKIKVTNLTTASPEDSTLKKNDHYADQHILSLTNGWDVQYG